MEDDEAWLYGDDQSAEASTVGDVKKDDVSIPSKTFCSGPPKAQNLYPW